METLKILLRDSRFWTALFLLVQAIVFWFVPDFPEPIWSAVNALVAVILAVLAGGQAVARVRAREGR